MMLSPPVSSGTRFTHAPLHRLAAPVRPTIIAEGPPRREGDNDDAIHRRAPRHRRCGAVVLHAPTAPQWFARRRTVPSGAPRSGNRLPRRLSWCGGWLVLGSVVHARA